jgi:hypothetical protein
LIDSCQPRAGEHSAERYLRRILTSGDSA